MVFKQRRILTCVLLRGHLRTHDGTEMLQPVLLLALCLAGEQEAAVRCFYGDTVLPGTVAVRAGGEAGGNAVTVVLVAQEHLALGKRILIAEIEEILRTSSHLLYVCN